MNVTSEEWINLNKEAFDNLFKSSAVKRTKFDGLKRNISFFLN